MTFPLYKLGAFGFEGGLIAAFLVGLTFGFVLERAGFGSARILASQFYFTNMRVLKVMFSAILTAMLGVFYFAWLGWLDLSMVYVSETFLLPQIVGGLIFGVGFVVGGYCPGTAVAAMGTFKIDAVFFLGGIAAGTLVFNEVFPLIEGFYSMTPLGELRLPDVFGISYGVVVFAVVLMALGAFAAAEWGERVMAKKGESA